MYKTKNFISKLLGQIETAAFLLYESAQTFSDLLLASGTFA